MRTREHKESKGNKLDLEKSLQYFPEPKDSMKAFFRTRRKFRTSKIFLNKKTRVFQKKTHLETQVKNPGDFWVQLAWGQPLLSS